jgi:hypothetical protein
MPKAFTYESVQNAFAERNCKLLSDTYTSSVKKLDFQCSCGKDSQITFVAFQYGSLCKDCTRKQKLEKLKKTNLERYGVEFTSQQKEVQARMSKTLKGKPRKFSLEFVRNFMNEQGCKLLNNEYTTDRVKLSFICICGKISQQSFNTFYHRGARCGNIDCIQARMKATNLQRYGVENALNVESVKQKIRETCKDKYGVDNVFKSDTIKQKIRKTCKRKYGVDYASQHNSVKQKVRETCLKKYGVACYTKSNKFKNYLQQFCLTNYGVRYIGQIPHVKAKIRKRFLTKYGVPCPMNQPQIRAELVSKHLKKHGVKHPMQREEVKEKVRRTFYKNYGTRHPMQNPVYAENVSRNSFLHKEYKLPSGKSISIQGYEDLALDELLKIYKEDEIFTSKKQVPEIWYIDQVGKYRRYYPDVYIPKDNIIIEVKSEYTYIKEASEFHKKRKACEYLGFKFESYIFKSNKSTRTSYYI